MSVGNIGESGIERWLKSYQKSNLEEGIFIR
jgi:hypothetical protein